MRICAAIGSTEEMRKHTSADMAEIRLDVFREIPDGLDVPRLITFKGVPDYSLLPEGFDEMMDVGESAVPITDATVVSSYHDMEHTPSADRIVEIMNGMRGDVSKGAFAVNGFADLASIYSASKMLDKRHVLIGMNELGKITRIRSDLLGNEFTFAHTGTPTAAGQLSIEEMRRLGDGCIITGIVGHPLTHSLSQRIHGLAFEKTGVNGIYLKFDVPSLDGIEDTVRDFNIRGLNVTIPYKTDIIRHMDEIDETARTIGAVNTVTNTDGYLTGTNTDITGIESAFKRAGVRIDASKRILVMGSGGSAKTCTYYFRRNDADVYVTGRNVKTVTELCSRFDCHIAKDADPREYDVIVNCTPVGMYSDSPYPSDIEKITSNQTVFDLVYDPNTPLNRLAEEHGCKIVKGMDMLVGQGLRSFYAWTGKTPDFNAIEEAIG
ncbi:MAG: shikimate dehydrogenase [Candidatus Methanomethylophilaceae archaeon]